MHLLPCRYTYCILCGISNYDKIIAKSGNEQLVAVLSYCRGRFFGKMTALFIPDYLILII